MFQLGVNKKIYPGHGGDNDIRLSLNDYKDLIMCMKDETLSNAALVRFKNLYTVNQYAQLNIMALSAVTAYAGAKIVLWGVNRQHAGYKLFLAPFVLFYLCQTARNGYKQVPRRLYTEILTDESSDGKYVRTELRQSTPHLWSHISRQMYALGYRFEEMNEVSMDVPTAILE